MINTSQSLLKMGVVIQRPFFVSKLYRLEKPVESRVAEKEILEQGISELISVYDPFYSPVTRFSSSRSKSTSTLCTTALLSSFSKSAT